MNHYSGSNINDRSSEIAAPRMPYSIFWHSSFAVHRPCSEATVSKQWSSWPSDNNSPDRTRRERDPRSHQSIASFGSPPLPILASMEAITEVEDDIARVTADAAYDRIAIYDAAGALGAKAVVPPIKTATRSRRRSAPPSARDRTIMRIKKVGRRLWKKEAGYHRQARVENTFFRYKTIIGPRLRARHPESQKAEAIIACSILNRMMILGRPECYPVGAC
jgi:hypothetical protein